VNELAAIAEFLASAPPNLVNVLLINSDMRVADLTADGVRRVSASGASTSAARAGFAETVDMRFDEGT